MLKLENVSTSYGNVPMLKDIDLAVEVGELVTLLGPNGAGKTTTFRAITGIVRPTQGSVTIDGHDTRRWPVSRIAKLGVGTVPEGRRLFPKLTVRENLRLGFQLTTEKIPFAEALEPIAERFPRVSERLDQQAGTLSGGEQAMVALARALISKPRYIVMDEPSLGLAPNLVGEYFNLVNTLRGGQQAILLIEQNVTQSLAIADRAYVLKKGQLVYSGSADDPRAADQVASAYLGKS